MSASLGIDTDEAATAWRGFAVAFAVTAALLGVAAVAFIIVLDPFGLRVGPGRAPGPIMDANQRYLYPQIARSGLYDAAVFGTSTSRLLDPRELDPVFGARFANLAINGATPYEQSQIAGLFLRRNKPKVLLFGLDSNWCEADADTFLTSRPMPAWLYEDLHVWSFLKEMNWRTLAMASAVLSHRFRLAKERIRGDGFAVFTPPEAKYDAKKASERIHSGTTPLDHPRGSGPPPSPSDPRMPALAWLDELLKSAPPEALKLVAFMPANAAIQGKPGTPEGERDARCKRDVTRIAGLHGATVIDFRIPSSVTTEDTNYWDSLHYRLPIARRIIESLKAVRDGGGDDPQGFYKVLTAG